MLTLDEALIKPNSLIALWIGSASAFYKDHVIIVIWI